MTTPDAPDADLGRLLVSCRDRPGLVAAISAFLHARGANIVQSDQDTTDPSGGLFVTRVVFRLPGLLTRLDELTREFTDEVATPLEITFRLRAAARRTRVAIFVSRLDHCLLDLLWRHRRGELGVEIVQVVSNHPDLADEVARFGVPFAHVPVTAETKDVAEKQQIELLAGRVDLVVLARYMQILTGGFLDALGVPAINIHHSFLPAFVGAAPYAQAKTRGVKIVGATAHYVTEDLDQGPIIEQDVARISHRDTVVDITRRGADVERTVLARAVAAHCDDRVVVTGGTTIVF
ncbi:formyltetrahydrofolate deformylase [Actinomycetospora sp. C-140]